MSLSFSQTYAHASKILSLNTAHANAENLLSAHVYTSIGHPDLRDYVSGGYPSLKVVEVQGHTGVGGSTHVTATSGAFPTVATKHGQGVTFDGTNWYVSYTNTIYKCSAIVTPTIDVTNSTPFSAGTSTSLDTDSGVTMDHIGDIQYYNHNGTGYIIASVTSGASAANDGGIAIYRASDLVYVSGSYSSLGAGVNIAAVSVDTSSYEFVAALYHNTDATALQVGSLDNFLTGGLSVSRTIALDVPAININGLHTVGGVHYLSWYANSGSMHLVTGYNGSGAPVVTYRGWVGSPQGVHIAGPTMYWLDGVSAGSGALLRTINIAAATEATSYNAAGIEVPNDQVSNYPNTALYNLYTSQVPDQGTRHIIFQVKTSSGTAQFSECFDDGDTSYWVFDHTVSGGKNRGRFYLKGSSAAFIETSDTGTTDDIPVDTTVSLTLTWDKTDTPTFSATFRMYFNGVECTGMTNASPATTTTAGDWIDATGFTWGRSNKGVESSNLLVCADYLYSGVKTAAQVAAIEADPYGMWNTG